MTSLATLDDVIARIRAHGVATALITVAEGGTRSWSYDELARGIDAVAVLLRDRGIARGEVVGLVGPNSPGWVATWLGAVVAGAVILPIDERLPDADQAQLLGDAGCRLVFAGTIRADALRACLGANAPPFVGIDDWAKLGSPTGDVAAPRRAAPDEVATLVYTSGTTGTPKGVPLTHANLAANLEALLAERLIAPGDRALLPLPLHHVYPLTVGLLTPLASGAAVVFPAGLGGPQLAEALRFAEVTHLVGVPKLYAALLDAIRARLAARGAGGALISRLWRWSTLAARHVGPRLGRPLFRAVRARLAPRLSLLISGGAALAPEHEAALLGLGWEVLTGYGLTETSPILTFNRRGAARIASAGRPIAGVALRIADADASGVGEIQAHGRSIFAGYRGDPGATRRAFTDDRWFRTGDLGAIDADGYLSIVARSNETIVLADGKKVFPEAIEDIYGASPFFRELAILAEGGALVALIVPDLEAMRAAGATAPESRARDILAQIAATLPPHQRVAGFALTRASLPRTPLGKIRRFFLPALYARARAGRIEAEAAPLGADDQALMAQPVAAGLWAWLEGRYPEHRLTLDTSPPLDLGIDSLGWVGLTLEIEGALGLRLTEEALGRVVTLRDLLREALSASASAAAAPKTLTAEQQRWLAALPWPLAPVRWLGIALNRLAIRAVFRLQVEGASNVPPAGPCVICANHASFLDPFVLGAALTRHRLRDVHWAGWTGLMLAGPLLRLFSRLGRLVPIDLARPGESIVLAAEVLRRGRVLVWFPEGARSRDGALQPFLPGIGMLIEAAPAPIVPARILGAFEAWPRDRRWPRPRPIRVVFGAPLDPAALLAAAPMGAARHPHIAAAVRAAVAIASGNCRDTSRDSRLEGS